uniref:Protein EARLY FLOWERING 4 domain-containing protein n=1 Tax=Kalanchoe fedtschenkoi TaxID=63787 RepID=A0A7N0UBK1_KALFE
MEAGGSGGSGEKQKQHNISQTVTTPTATPKKSRKRDSSSRGGGDVFSIESSGSRGKEENPKDGGGGGDESWQLFGDRFRDVQLMMDHNQILMEQVNENHRSRIADNMVKNVALIQEINENISKIRDLYSGLSSDVLTFCQHRAASGKDSGDKSG